MSPAVGIFDRFRETTSHETFCGALRMNEYGSHLNADKSVVLNSFYQEGV